MNRELEIHIEKYLHEQIDKKNRQKDALRRANKKYKQQKCASLQVFIDKDIVYDFKERVKKNGHTQAGVLRGFIKSYLSIGRFANDTDGY